MPRLEKMDPATCRKLAELIEQALAPIAKEYGLTVKAGGGKYEAGYFEPKVRLAIVAADGTVATPEAGAFKQLAYFYNLKPEDLGRTFDSNGRTYKLTGLKGRAGRFPFIGADVKTGKQWKFTAETVQRALGVTPPTVGTLTETDPPIRK